MAYQPLDAATKASIIQQAQARAAASGLSAEQELYNYAQSQGIDAAGIDTMMGMENGATAAWLARTQPANPNPYGAVDISQIKPQTAAPTPAPVYSAPAAPTPAAATPATRQPLTAEENAHVRALANEQASAQGITPEQALYNYAQSNHIDNATIDTLMGWGSGITDNWLAQHPQGTPRAATPTTPASVIQPGQSTSNAVNTPINNGAVTAGPLSTVGANSPGTVGNQNTTGNAGNGSQFGNNNVSGSYNTDSHNSYNGWGTAGNAGAPVFNTPVLDALYQGQQQRMTSQAPTFNFQQKPVALKNGGPVVGALTKVIRG